VSDMWEKYSPLTVGVYMRKPGATKRLDDFVKHTRDRLEAHLRVCGHQHWSSLVCLTCFRRMPKSWSTGILTSLLQPRFSVADYLSAHSTKVLPVSCRLT
jgi:hypothetical protein